MKPHKILVFLCLILTVVLGIALLFPKAGFLVGNTFKINFSLNIGSVFSNEIQYADIAEIIEENQELIHNDTLNVEIMADSLAIDTLRASIKELKAKIQTIEYPAKDSTILFAFFKKLDNSQNKRVRIMHYGDSQIEGDRITGYLRNRFQRQFGGSGPGLMPAIPGNAESASIKHSASKNWVTHSVYYKKDTILPHRKFGVLGSFARFTSYKADSLGIDSTLKDAYIEFARSGMAYASVNKFSQCRVFYGHCNDPFIVKGFIDDSLIWFEEMDTAQITQQFQWNFAVAPKKFRIEFEGIKSPDIYGIALDAANGVAVDNLPFRGSSGTEFTKLDFNQFYSMAGKQNSGLIILEFGVNVVPHQVSNYNFYERALTRQIKYLNYIFPNTPVLVIGLSDMSKRKGNYYESYPNILKIRMAQRNAARNTNSAFWDLYSAMGGENSMPSWVFANPPLARKDFTHFNRKGGHIVAQMLYNALMQEYNQYKNMQEKELLSIKG